MASSTLDKFCGSEFWNSSVTWYTNDPDFTECFQQTVLVWIPCFYLWIFSSLDVYYILSSKRADIPWNILNISKFLVTSILVLLSVIDLGIAINRTMSENIRVYNVEIYTPLLRILTFILSATLLLYNRKHGLQISGLLFQFWLFAVICGAPQFRTEIRAAQIKTPDPYYNYISYIIYYPLVILIFFLNCFADKAPKFSKYPVNDKPCPEVGSSFLSRILYSWFDPLAWKGFRNPLETKDLWDMNPEDAAYEVVPAFDKNWQKTVQKLKSAQPSSQTNASFKSDSARVDFVGNTKKRQASILPALVKTFGPTFMFGALLKLSQDVLMFVNPQLLRALISFVEKNEEQWKGLLYAALLFAVATIQTLVLSQYFQRMFLVGMRIRTALISTIYRKALKMSNIAKKESTVGEIVNLMSVDAQKFIELTAYLNMIWSAPLQIILALYFLWDILGPSVLAGLAVMIIMIPINGYIANKVKVLQIKQMKNKDERVKLMNEVLSGIKVLKLYAWEPSFEKQVLKIREKEMKVLKQAAYLNAGTSFIWSCAPFLVTMLTFVVYVCSDEKNVLTPQKAFVALTLFGIIRIPMSLLPLLIVYVVEVSLVSFATYVLVDENNVLDASKAFVSLSLFNILRFPLSMLPMMISNMVQTWVSVKRINKFMNCDELDPHSVFHDQSDSYPLVIENGNFHWGEGPVLKDINVYIPKNTLTAVVGSVGSGKSSLLSAFLGEMVKTSGRVNTQGAIAYVSQQAWIQNATLQDNILFGRPLNKKLYDQIVEACALKPDFDMLPAGDQTEIGEKGINLSGGQKQRISLARAVYADADVYLLDDPLSAVDSHVGKHIFEQVIGPNGLLRIKTRVLVTHGITYLPQTDKIIVIKDGEVSETGSYQELLDRKGAFSEFLIQHITEAAEEETEDLSELQDQLSGTNVSEEITRKLARHISRVSESVSETGSERANGSVQHLNSVRKRSSVGDAESKKLATGEKLIEAEKAETGSVKWEVYKHYLKSIGVSLTVATLVLNLIFQSFSIGSNVWLSAWSSDEKIVVNGTTDTARRDMYLGVYGALGIGQAISMFVSSVTLYIGSLRGARYLHDLVLNNVVRAPCTTFYDVTPVGRILNRFSKDVDVVDNVLPLTLRAWITCFLSALLLCFIFYDFFSFIFWMIWDFMFSRGCVIAAGIVHASVLTNVIRLPMTFFDVTPIGRILVRFSSDTQVIDNVLPHNFKGFVPQIYKVVATLFVISFTTPIFIAVIIPIGFLYYFIQRFYVATSRQLKRLESVSRSPIYSHFGETVTGAQVIRAFNEEDRFIKESEAKVDFNQVCYYPSIIANRWLAVRLEMVGNLIILFSALFAVLGKDQNPGLVGLSVSYALQITQTLNWLVRMTSDVETNIVAVERIKEYGETQQEAPWEIPNKQPAVTWPEKGAVEFQNYAVRYRPGLDLVLKGVNFSVKGGEKIGIVGRTGAGKSSLTLALFRIIEASQGEIYIDGVNVAELGLHSLRSRLTIIPQDAVLFSGTLRMNLDPFDTHTDNEVWTALEQAHLKSFVKGLPAGLTHEVAEGGENLSVGQRQLICLSRALLRKTKVLVLDEATAAVDLETDDLIQKTIRTEFKDCTVLTIAHRLNTIMDSDRIIVLDKGLIVEFDSPASLLANKNTIFYGMCKDAGLV